MKKTLLILVFVLLGITLVVNHYVGFLYPYIPFYNYYGVTPPDEAWKNCEGTVTYINGEQKQSDNDKKFDYWTVRAIKENNPNLCRNVGVSEGSDVVWPDEHAHAIETCNYIVKNNPTFVNQCKDIK